MRANKNNTAKELDELEKDLEVGNESQPVKSKPVEPTKKRAQKKEGKRYTPDFKKMVIKERKNGATYAELYKKYSVYASQIITWTKKVK